MTRSNSVTAVLILFSLVGVGRISAAQQTEQQSILRTKNLTVSSPSSTINGAATSFGVEASSESNSASFQTSLAYKKATFLLGLSAKPKDGAATTVFNNATKLSSGTTASFGLSGVWFLKPAATGVDRGRVILEWCNSRQREGRIPKEYNCKEFDSAKLTDSMREEYDAIAPFSKNPLIWLLEASSGPTDFNFTTDAGKLDSVSHWQSGVRVGVGGFLNRVFLSGSVGYKDSYKAGDAALRCSGKGLQDSVLLCAETKRNAPKHLYGTSIAVDVRTLVRGKIGIALSPQYDGSLKVFSAKLPIYFAPDSKNSLIGGILSGWDSKSKEFKIGLFVGTAFGLSVAKPQ